MEESTMRIILLLSLMLLVWPPADARAAALKIIAQKTAGEFAIAVLNESGQWTTGTNSFVLQLKKAGQPADVGKVALDTSMAMPGMAPMRATATLQADGPGMYHGRIVFPDRGPRDVTVTWDGPAGRGSTKFTVRVR